MINIEKSPTFPDILPGDSLSGEQSLTTHCGGLNFVGNYELLQNENTLHGSAADAIRFLNSVNVTSVTPDVFNQLYQMSTGSTGVQIRPVLGNPHQSTRNTGLPVNKNNTSAPPKDHNSRHICKKPLTTYHHQLQPYLGTTAPHLTLITSTPSPPNTHTYTITPSYHYLLLHTLV